MDQLVLAFDHLAFSRYASVAGAALWVYDYLLTCREEYTRIWPSRWSLVKVLFFVARYIAVPYIPILLQYILRPAISLTFCRFTNVSMSVMRIIEIIAETWIVMIRVRVLYAGHIWALRLLLAAFVITHCVNIFIGIHSMVETYTTTTFSQAVRLCITIKPRFAQAAYFTQLPLEAILLSTLLFHYWKLSRRLAPVKPTPLFLTLYSDGVLYFGAIVSLRIWAGLVIALLDMTYWPMTLVIDLTTSSALISRMVIRLNKIANRGPLDDTFLTTGDAIGTGTGGTSVATPGTVDGAVDLVDIQMDGMRKTDKSSSRVDGDLAWP